MQRELFELATSSLRLVVLGSGSRGNAIVIEASGRRILVDAGFSAREICRRLELVGVDPAGIDAVVLTHEHRDHSRGAEVLSRRFGMPVYGTAGTVEAVSWKPDVRSRVRAMAPDRPVEISDFLVEPFLVPHDAAEPVGLVVSDGQGRRIGVAADLGCRSRLAWARLRDLDALVLETNHDFEMLRNGPYPWPLKQRVASRHGHLSNRDAADGLAEILGDDLQWLVLYHLSQTNNLPTLAAAVVGEELDRRGSSARVVVTDQDEPSPWVEICK